MAHAIIALAFISVYVIGKKKKSKPCEVKETKEAKDRTIVDILPMNIIDRIAAETDAKTIFALKRVCKAFNTDQMQVIGEKFTKDATRNAFFALLHCIRRFVTLFNNPVVTRKFIANILSRMDSDVQEAMRAKKFGKDDYRIAEYEAMMDHLISELDDITIMHANELVRRLRGLQSSRHIPHSDAAYDVIKNYFIGKQQEYHVTLEIHKDTVISFQQIFVYENNKLMMYGSINHSEKDTKSNNEQIHHIRKHIPSMELEVSNNNKQPHRICFEATPENINGFVNMMYETSARGLFDNPDIIVPYMDICFMNANFNNWYDESFTRHVFTERIEAIHKVNHFLGKPWNTSYDEDENDRYKPYYYVCKCGKCLKSSK